MKKITLPTNQKTLEINCMNFLKKKKSISEIEMEAASDQFSTKIEVINYSIMITRRLGGL